MAAKFEITRARVGHTETVNGNQLKLVVYTSRKTGTNDAGEAQFASDKYDLIAFGQRAQDWTSLEKGAMLAKVSGELRGSQMVVWEIEATEATPASTEVAEASEEAAPEAEAPKAKKTGRRKVKKVEDDLI